MRRKAHAEPFISCLDFALVVFLKLFALKKRSLFEGKEIVIDDTIINSGDFYAVIEPVRWVLAGCRDRQEYERRLSLFSLPQQHVFVISWYLSEVRTGGHRQFFHHSKHIRWETLIKAFEAIGLTGFPDIIRNSVVLLGRSHHKQHLQCQGQPDRFKPDFSELDGQICMLAETIQPILMGYIKTHRIKFYFDSTSSYSKRFCNRA